MNHFAPVEEALRGGVGDVYFAAQLAVVDAGRLVWSTAVGDADEETWFDLASLTKALSTTLLVARLGDRGLVTLADTPREGVSVEALLAHASGLPAWLPLWRDLGGVADQRAAMIARARAEPLTAPPLTRAVYSDLGFILLGDWLEQRGGARQDALFASELAAPHGLALAYLPREASSGRRCAPMQSLDADLPANTRLEGVVHDDNCRHMGGVAGHAGLFGTARAVAQLAALLLADHADGAARVVSREWLERLWTPSGVPGSTWCRGWDRPSPGASQAGSLWPRDGVGHLGFTGCSLWLDPARGRAVALLSNRIDPRRENERIRALRPRLHDLVWRALSPGF